MATRPEQQRSDLEFEANTQAVPYDEIDLRILKLASLAALRVDQPRLDSFRQLLVERMRKDPSKHYYDEWLAIIDKGPAAVVRALVDTSDRGRALRTVAPLKAFVSHSERNDAFRLAP